MALPVLARRGIGIGFVFATAAVAGYLAMSNGGSPATNISTSREAFRQNPIATICGGDETTMAEATSQTPFRLMIPDHAKANEKSVASVWDCPGDDVAMVFDSGITTYQSRNSLVDPERTFEQMAEEYEEFSVGKIRGLPAQFSDPMKSANGTAPGGVDWVEDGIRYIVSGDGDISLEELRQVASSFQRYE